MFEVCSKNVFVVAVNFYYFDLCNIEILRNTRSTSASQRENKYHIFAFLMLLHN